MQTPRLAHVFAAAALTGALALAGCSLGTGVVPTCDFDAATPDPDCDPETECDDGSGRIKPTAKCCLYRANDEYNLVCQAENAAGADYKEKCPLNLTGDTVKCCTAAISAENACLGKK